MSQPPSVSVITIFWNAARFLGEAVASVLAQTYADWELLLVDDGSTDAGPALARAYAAGHPGRVRYLEHPGRQNRGMSASRNLGLRHARGRYVTFLDADDVFLPQALERMVALLASCPAAGAVRGLCQYWYGWTGNPKDIRRDYIPALGLRPNSLFRPPALLTLSEPLGKAPFPGMGSVMVRRDVLNRIGGFEEAVYGLGEDDVFYIKLYLRESVLVSDECWFRYRQHPDSCCSAAARTGGYSSLRLAGDWLGEYLGEQGVDDPRIWRAYKKVLWYYRHPLLWHFRPTSVARRAAGWWRRVARWGGGAAPGRA
jgi:glycosyltransferase involved in cell wall biosynthesis